MRRSVYVCVLVLFACILFSVGSRTPIVCSSSEQLGGRLTVLQRAAVALNIECPDLMRLDNKTSDPAANTHIHTHLMAHC